VFCGVGDRGEGGWAVVDAGGEGEGCVALDCVAEGGDCYLWCVSVY
jgi:hypothetical protein